MENAQIIRLTHYIPIATTILSAIFAFLIIKRWRTKRHALYLLWWGLGVITYGVGTLLESLNTLLGWDIVIFKLWYIAGALLGGAPLALGTIYLLLGTKWGHRSVFILALVVFTTSIFVLLSPIDMALVDPQILNSKVLEWQQIRLVSPFINTLAAIFLIGGALYSAANYRKDPEMRNRYIGNIYIAIGALLPGIGGAYSRIGYTEVLYIGEFVGLLCIWYGYAYCQRRLSLAHAF